MCWKQEVKDRSKLEVARPPARAGTDGDDLVGLGGFDLRVQDLPESQRLHFSTSTSTLTSTSKPQ